MRLIKSVINVNNNYCVIMGQVFIILIKLADRFNYSYTTENIDTLLLLLSDCHYIHTLMLIAYKYEYIVNGFALARY